MDSSKDVMSLIVLWLSFIDCGIVKYAERRSVPCYQFFRAVRRPTFVDKSLMITYVLEGPRFMSITAPRGFGKSTNLDMLKTFLSIPVDSQGQRNIERETQISDLFKKFLIHKRYPYLFQKHICQYVVISVDFDNIKQINSTESAADVLKKIIHRSFKSHEYLCASEKLDVSERNLCKTWIKGHYDKIMHVNDVLTGFKRLASFLFKVFGKKVWILVDNYEVIMKQAMLHVDDDSVLESIMNFVLSILGQDELVENSCIYRVVVTGCSYLVGMGRSRFSNVTHYGFLDDHPFVDFYGFTETEVGQLFNTEKFELSRHLIRDARLFYDGYVSKKGIKVYHTFSILKFLEKREVRHYCLGMESLGGHLVHLFAISAIRDRIHRMLTGKSVTIKYVEQISCKEILQLRNIIEENVVENNSIENVFLPYLLEMGYFSFVGVNEITIASREIGSVLQKTLGDYYGYSSGVPFVIILDCAHSFQELFSKAKLRTNLVRFHSLLSEYFSELIKSNRTVLSRNTLPLMLYPFFAKRFYIQTDRPIRFTKNGQREQGTVDMYLTKRHYAAILELQFTLNQKPDCEVGFKQIIEMNKYSIFENEHFTSSKVKQYLIISLSINKNVSLSLCCSANSHELKYMFKIPIG